MPFVIYGILEYLRLADVEAPAVRPSTSLIIP